MIPVNYVMVPHLYLMSDCGGVILRSPVSERHPSMEPRFGRQNPAVGAGAGLSAAAYCRRDVITVWDDSHEKVGRQTASHFSPPPQLWLFSK